MKILYDYAMGFVGLPYRWGGSNPISGFDCSGFIQELLSSVGIDPPGDQSAQALYDFFEKDARWNEYGCGSLVFYGQDSRHITHIAMMVDNYCVIEAGGGGSKTVTKDDADKQNAYIRLRIYNHRKDVVAILKPRYSSIGLIP